MLEKAGFCGPPDKKEGVGGEPNPFGEAAGSEA
jgi:hypothetical protein